MNYQEYYLSEAVRGGSGKAKIFPDTNQGAVDALTASAKPAFITALDLPNCKVFRRRGEPTGVWIIQNRAKKAEVTVYLAGYEFEGRVQPFNDFEGGDNL